MRVAEIYINKELAGILKEENPKHYTFRYVDHYYSDKAKPAISMTLSKQQQEYISPYLFPFFYNMLSEGVNKRLQSRQLHLDEDDSFGLLLATAQVDTIGAITIKPLMQK